MRQNKRVVLFGQMGSGKTTLFNQLTGQKEETRVYGNAITKQIALGQTCSNNPFEVIDTPGLGGMKNKLQKVGGILAALEQENIHRIILVIKFDRIDFILRQLSDYMKIFQKYKDGITVFVSNCQESNREIIKNQLLDKFQIKSVIFNSEVQEINHELIQQSHQILDNSQEIKIQFSDNEIFQNFQPCEIDNDSEICFQYEVLKIQFYRELRDITSKFRQIMNKTQNLFECSEALQKQIIDLTNELFNRHQQIILNTLDQYDVSEKEKYLILIQTEMIDTMKETIERTIPNNTLKINIPNFYERVEKEQNYLNIRKWLKQVKEKLNLEVYKQKQNIKILHKRVI